MKAIDKATIWIGALTAALLAATAVLYARLPVSIPIHWDSAGAADGWAAKPWAFLLASSPVLATALVRIAAAVDPRYSNIKAREGTFVVVVVSVAALAASLHLITIVTALGLLVGTDLRLVPLAAGLAFVAIGNVMPRLKWNYTVGIRLPWTLADEGVWRATHRFGGVAFVLAGLATAATAFMPERAARFVGGGAILSCVAATTAYSYAVHRSRRDLGRNYIDSEGGNDEHRS